jgi:hypothetical protein
VRATARVRYNARVPGAVFSTLLRRSLETLERERPDVAARLAATLGALDVAIRVGEERVGLRAEDGRVVVAAPPPEARVDVVTGRDTILALVDGEVSLVDAVVGDALALRGAVPDLARFHDALWLYLQGAVRAPSFPALLRAFRDAS